jgi:hypothetical protein
MMDLVRLHRLFNNSGTLCLLRFSNGSTNNLRRSAVSHAILGINGDSIVWLRLSRGSGVIELMASALRFVDVPQRLRHTQASAP